VIVLVADDHGDGADSTTVVALLGVVFLLGKRIDENIDAWLKNWAALCEAVGVDEREIRRVTGV
jgi:hypothetical protein